MLQLHVLRVHKSTLLSKMNDAQELVRANTATIELPKVDADIILQQTNGLQDSLLAKMNDAQEIVRTNTATVELPKGDSDSILQQKSTECSIRHFCCCLA
jgi:hypothetical protein